MRRKRIPRFESLESRAVLNAGPVGLVQFNDVNSWQWQNADVSQKMRVNSPDELSEWEPVLIEDFTGDGIPDTLGTELSSGGWVLQSNNGSQLYLESYSPALPEREFLQPIDSADFNNDGLIDMLSWNELSGEIWVSLNSFAGFNHQVWTTFTPNAQWQELIVDDFDGDGFVDLLGGESSGSWWLAKNTGGTGFQNHHWGNFPQFDWIDVVSGDFSGDGLPDIAARAPGNTWWVWQGSSTQLLPANYWGHWKMAITWSDIQVADFNNDGRDDLIGRSENGQLFVGSSTGNDSFHTWSWGSGWVASANWSNITIADINADGLLDYAGKAEGGTWWYAENQEGRFYNYFWLKAPEAAFEQIVAGFFSGLSRPQV